MEVNLRKFKWSKWPLGGLPGQPLFKLLGPYFSCYILPGFELLSLNFGILFVKAWNSLENGGFFVWTWKILKFWVCSPPCVIFMDWRLGFRYFLVLHHKNKGYWSLFQVMLWNVDIFVLELLLNKMQTFSVVILLLRDRSVSSAQIAGGKLEFVCLGV